MRKIFKYKFDLFFQMVVFYLFSILLPFNNRSSGESVFDLIVSENEGFRKTAIALADEFVLCTLLCLIPILLNTYLVRIDDSKRGFYDYAPFKLTILFAANTVFLIVLSIIGQSVILMFAIYSIPIYGTMISYALYYYIMKHIQKSIRQAI